MNNAPNIQFTQIRKRLPVASLMALAAVAWSADPLPVGTGTGLAGSYYVNQAHSIGRLSETPVLTRTDPGINFNWGTASPGPGITADQFSVVWNGSLEPQVTGTHTIYVTSDNGRRVWINGTQIINQWNDTVGAYSATVDLVAGQKVPIRVDFYENTGSASVKLEWEAAGLVRAVIPATQLYPEALPVGTVGTGTGLLAGYFPGPSFTGTPIVKTDRSLNFSWPSVPTDGIPSENFTVRWQGKIATPLNEATTLILSTDDGARMWIDGVQVVNDWTVHGTKEYRFAMPIGAGVAHDIRIDYFNGTVPGTAKLEWEGQHTPRMPVPMTQLYAADSLLTPAATNGAGLSAAYYANQTLTGPAVRRRDRTIDFNWGSGSPDAAIPVDHFSASWTGKIQTRFDETYTLIITGDDGVRAWLNGVQVVNDWINTAAKARTYSFAAKAGQKYDLRIEYYDYTGSAMARLEWSSPSEGQQVVPEACLYPNDLDVNVPTVSTVSPAFIEGLHGPELTVNAGSGSVTALGESRFFANEPLNPTAATAVSLAAGSVTVTGAIAWTPTLLNADQALVVRPGDSVLFKATASGTWGIGMNCGSFRAAAPINAGDLVPVRFDAPGYYQATESDANGAPIATISINVPQVVTAGSIPVSLEYTRNKDVSYAATADLTLVTWTASDQWIGIGSGALPAGSPGTVKRLTVKSSLNRPSWLTARINGNGGPILACLPVQPFLLRSNSDKYIAVLKTYPDGSKLCEANMVMAPQVKGLQIKMKTIVSGVTFSDSTTSKTFMSDDFAAWYNGMYLYKYDLIRAPGIKTGVCHTWEIYDGVTAIYLP